MVERHEYHRDSKSSGVGLRSTCEEMLAACVIRRAGHLDGCRRQEGGAPPETHGRIESYS